MSIKASKAKALAVATLRANEGMANDILDQISDAYFERGLSVGEAIDEVQDSLIQRAIERYSEKIRAALSRAGLDLQGEITIDAIKQAVIDKTGLQLDDLTPEAMIEAVDSLAASRLSEATGVPINSVMSGEGLGEQIKEGVRKAIENGTAETLILKGMGKAARAVVTWRRAGFDEDAQRRAMNAHAQKKYRRTHRMVWD